MVECNACGEDVLEVWRRAERSDSMTHRQVSWLCRECNPDVHRPVERVSGGGRATNDSGTPQASD